MCEFLLATSRGLLQCLQQTISFMRGRPLRVMNEEISYIGDANAVRWRDEPKTTFGPAPGFNKSCPGHQLKDLGSLRRWEPGRSGDLVSLKRSSGIRQAA